METTKEKTRKSVSNLKAKYQLLCKVVDAIPSTTLVVDSGIFLSVN